MAVPSDYAGLQVHYQYNTGYWQDSARTTAATAAGDPLGAWDDQSGNARHATQSTNARRPTLSSVSLAPAFSQPSNQWLALPNFLTGFTVGDVFMLLRAEYDPAIRTVAFSCFGSSGDNDHYPWTDGIIYNTFGTNVRKTVGNISPYLGKYHVLRILSKSGTWSMWIDDVQVFTTASNTVGWTTAPSIGKGVGSFFWDGRLAEMFLYSQERSGAEATALVSYLNGVYATFPSGTLRNTQTEAEFYSTGGETLRNTQTEAEVYSTGGETFRNTQTQVEVYTTEHSRLVRNTHTRLDVGQTGDAARNTNTRLDVGTASDLVRNTLTRLDVGAASDFVRATQVTFDIGYIISRRKAKSYIVS